MDYRYYILLLTISLYSLTINGQILPFKNYTVKDGLPSNYVSDIVQDKKGYMWLATDIGLAKFDGYHFKTYTIEDGLSDNFINCLTVDNNGNIWAGTETGGVSVINDFGIRYFDESDSLVPGSINRVFTDRENGVWVCGYDAGISRILEGSVETYTNENSIFNSNVFCHHIDTKGVIWLGTYDGVFYYDTTLKRLDYPQINDLIVWSIIEDSEGTIWIASQDNGLFAFTNGKITEYNTSNGLSSDNILSVIEDYSGKIWVGTYYGGINIIDNGEIDKSLVTETEDYWIWDLFEDSNNRIWARTQEQGVLLVQNKNIGNYSKDNNLVSSFVYSIYEDNHKNIWFATKDGISSYGHIFFEIYSSGFALDDNHILTVHIDKEKRLYAGSYNGLTIYYPDNTSKAFTDNDLAGNASVLKIIESKQDEIWLATKGLSKLSNNIFQHSMISEEDPEKFDAIPRDLIMNNDTIYGATYFGLLIYDTKTGKHSYLTKENGLITDDLFSLALDNKGNLWCGTSDGLSILSNNRFYNYNVKHGLPNNFCNDIAFDERNVAWIGTDYGLCAAVISDNFVLSTRNFSTDDGLKSNSIVSVIADRKKHIWMGHNKGVDKLHIITKEIVNYGLLEGFLPIECQSGATAIDSDENIWFGTIDGVVKYNPVNDVQNLKPPKVYIKSVNLYNDTSSLEQYYSAIDSITLLPRNLKLHHSKDNLYFNYVGLHYTIVDKNTYQYRLLGYEQNWSKPTHEIQSIPYRKLPHGKYTFQVIAANCDGIWSGAPAQFSFEIKPPFWQTWWFRIIEVVVGIFIFYLIIYLRERKLIHDKKVLTQKVKERTIEIEKQKDQIERQRDEITHQKKEITDSIQYAKHIQSAILANHETIKELLKDYFILFKPRDIVSGDFYWIHGKDNRVIAIAADCTGHGVPGAFMSMLGVAILNEIATKDDISASHILDVLREHIISTLSHTEGDEETRDGMDMALSIIDYNSYTLEFAGAYNPLVLIRNGAAEIHKGSKMPVGKHSGELRPFENHILEIQKGDCLYMFSDGYADQFGGPNGRKYKSGTFRKKLEEISVLPMPEQGNILDVTIEEWMEGYEQIDDILVLGIRII